MNVVLTEHQSSLISRLIKGGRYNNQSEVVRDALRRLEHQEESAPTCAQLAEALEHSKLSQDEAAAFAADVAEYRKRANVKTPVC
jgi:putative addiction module CopG family antidote